jgi:uncharacterized protein (DUF849 family)
MRAPLAKVFITVAVTGNLTTPQQTPYLPITPVQIADACLESARAGVAIVADGTLDGPPLCSFVMGVRYGFQPGPETVLYARELLPPGSTFTAIGIGRHVFTAAGQSFLAAGHVRVGLEDGVYLNRAELAPSNAAMVVKARRIIEDLGGEVASAAETRAILGLPASNLPS